MKKYLLLLPIVILITLSFLLLYCSYGLSPSHPQESHATPAEISVTWEQTATASGRITPSNQDSEPQKQKPEEEIPQTQESAITFVVLGDSRPADAHSDQPEVFKKIIKDIENLDPNLVFMVGDIVFGGTRDESTFRRQYEDFIRAVKPIRDKLHVAPGNHDTPNQLGQKLFREYVEEELYHSFDYKGSHFIVLDTEMVGSAGKIEKEQLKWLEGDLERNKGAENIFVFMHQPLYSLMNPETLLNSGRHLSFTDKQNQDYLRELLQKYPVKAVFAGHEHFFNYSQHGQITYVITGCSGAYPYTDRRHGGFYHYVVIKVTDKNFNLRVFEPGGKEVDLNEVETPGF